MDTIVLSFFYKGQILHVLESGKVITNSGNEASGMSAEVREGISAGGELGYMVSVFDGGNKIAIKSPAA